MRLVGVLRRGSLLDSSPAPSAFICRFQVNRLLPPSQPYTVFTPTNFVSSSLPYSILPLIPPRVPHDGLFWFFSTIGRWRPPAPVIYIESLFASPAVQNQFLNQLTPLLRCVCFEIYSIGQLAPPTRCFFFSGERYSPRALEVFSFFVRGDDAVDGFSFFVTAITL